MSDVPAGWYPDPAAVPGFSILRYWDGLRWTEHVHHQAVVAVRQTPTTPDGQPLAGWWHRVGATVIDGIFAIIVGTVLTLPVQISMQREQRVLNEEFQRRLDAGDPHALSWFVHHFLDQYRDHAWIYVLFGLVLIVAHSAFLHLWGGTPGQLVTGLRTRLREAPGPLSWARAFVRVMAYSGATAILQVIALASGSLAVVGVTFLVINVWAVLNPLWAAWDGKRQALHDKLVGSNVVRVRR
ncbi:RDD family protein [Nocardioides sp. Iso805N]|uniref:RDD family protein n=1 Tax=Nocardioides sp. Iso805N TaxID=1283287 RepID=UPI000368B318|nr:RDD family protein [Nocardioides sp. Iso805N]